MRRKSTHQFMIFGLLMLALIFGSAPAWADTIKIGVAGPFTGGAAAFGDNIKTGVTMKMEEINAAGGVNGMKLEAVWGDDRCEPKEAGGVASRFAMDKKIVAVIGHVCSSPALTALPIYIRNGLVSISPTATNVTIGKAGKGWFFRNVYRDDFQGKFLANYVNKVLGSKRVAIFYENNDYAIGLQKAFSDEGKTLGFEVVGAEAFSTNTTDFAPQLTKLLARKPDAIFLCGFYQEGALIARQARGMKFTGPLFGADGIDNTEYIQIAGKAANNTYLTVPFLAEAAGPEGSATAIDDALREEIETANTRISPLSPVPLIVPAQAASTLTRNTRAIGTRTLLRTLGSLPTQVAFLRISRLDDFRIEANYSIAIRLVQ